VVWIVEKVEEGGGKISDPFNIKINAAYAL
jgi:hypothetical protein